MTTTHTVTLTTVEILKFRKAGWDAGWQDAENWHDQHCDSDGPVRMPDFTRGTYEMSNFIDESEDDMTSEDDELSKELWQAYCDAVEDIIDDAARDAWDAWRDQHCDEDNCLVRDDD